MAVLSQCRREKLTASATGKLPSKLFEGLQEPEAAASVSGR